MDVVATSIPTPGEAPVNPDHPPIPERRTERQLPLPVLGIGGAQGIGGGAASTMKLAADDMQSVVIPGCGHYCLEEAPEEVVAALTAFLARTGKASDMSVVVVTAFPVPEHRPETRRRACCDRSP